jgi:glutamate dehydrogenase
MASRWIPEDRADSQIEWFYTQLGIDDAYFQIESVEVISNHITSLYAAKVAAVVREDKREEIRLSMEAADRALYIDTSEPGMTYSHGPKYEQRLEAKYLDGPATGKRFRVETFRSPSNLTGTATSGAAVRCYFVYQCQFVEPNPSPQETRLQVISDRMFLAKATSNTMQIYQEIIELAVTRTGPVIHTFDVEGSLEKRVVVAYRQRTAPGIFSALSDLYHYYGVISSRKYVEQFSNETTVISMYLKSTPGQTPNNDFPPIEQSIHQIAKEISLLYCIPRNAFHSLFATSCLSLQETIYGHCVWVFVQHFLNRLGTSLFLITITTANLLQGPNIRH